MRYGRVSKAEQEPDAEPREIRQQIEYTLRRLPERSQRGPHIRKLAHGVDCVALHAAKHAMLKLIDPVDEVSRQPGDHLVADRRTRAVYAVS